ncbi:hypothetical protein [Nocardioides dongkuii]|uniref:hypothetical protein n=1 Tax=Nocardioides dongkuii TaxID=2760089 RepID=UPI0015FA0501|nr:hypothetical protein [Nocardioides dongkuii]
MRNEWVPASAALLVTGAMALALASILTPDGSNAAETLRLVREQDSRWLAVSAIYFLAAAMLILGLPSLLVLLDRPRGRYVGLAGVVSLAIGFVGVAGYAALLVFFRALVKTEAIRDQALDALGEDVGLRIFLYGWIVAFLLGELLLAAALLRARSTPRWAPLLMLGHVLTVPLAALLPDAVTRTTALAFALAFAGVGVRAADAHLGSVRRLVV